MVLEPNFSSKQRRINPKVRRGSGARGWEAWRPDSGGWERWETRVTDLHGFDVFGLPPLPGSRDRISTLPLLPGGLPVLTARFAPINLQ